MAFFEIEFSRYLALGMVGGPGYSTSVNDAFSGYEQRNENWSQSRGQWTVGFENKYQNDYQQLLGWFHGVRGMAHAFRLFDPTDFSAQGQFIATADGVQTTFQLQKTYTFPVTAQEQIRPIQKPITSLVKDFFGALSFTDTVNVYDNGVLKSHNAGYVAGGGVAYTLDEKTGIIAFAAPPANGHVITADFQFHWPVRFNLDELQTQYLTGRQAPNGILITVTGIKLFEVRIKPGQSS